MWGSISLDGDQGFITISADWYLNVTGFAAAGLDVRELFNLDLISVAFKG